MVHKETESTASAQVVEESDPVGEFVSRMLRSLIRPLQLNTRTCKIFPTLSPLHLSCPKLWGEQAFVFFYCNARSLKLMFLCVTVIGAEETEALPGFELVYGKRKSRLTTVTLQTVPGVLPSNCRYLGWAVSYMARKDCGTGSVCSR